MHWKTTKPCSYYLTFLHFDHVLGITLGHGSEEDEGDVLHQQQELTTASDEVSKHLVMKAGMKKDTFSHWIMINLYEYSLPFEQGAPSTSWARSRPSSRRRARRRRWSTGRARRRAPPPMLSPFSASFVRHQGLLKWLKNLGYLGKKWISFQL